MDIMTKVRVLWEKVAGITADVSAVDAKATATAATLADILPRIPKDYSSEEVNTGVKWIDGKDIYVKTFSGTASETTTGTETIGNISFYSIVSFMFYYNSGVDIRYTNIMYVKLNGEVVITKSASVAAKEYTAYIYYTKPDPVPAQADNENKKRKTTKKEEK